MLLVFCVGLLAAVDGAHARCSNRKLTKNIVNNSTGPVCGPNSHYDGCVTACPLTCDNYDNPPEVCNAGCNPGCECDEGFVRAKSGQCVKPKQCPTKRSVSRVQQLCGPNSHYDGCVTACPLTCDNYDNPPEVCNAGCGEGCKCNDDYVIGPDGSCIFPELCPQCGPNSHYSSCGTDCPLTCDNYRNPPQVCTARCNPGCECDEGFVRAKGGQCVKPKQCPTKRSVSRVQQLCGPNSHYDGCATACPLTCDNYDNPPEVCNAGCGAGCNCNDGYVLAKDGSCILPNQCQACGPNSHYDGCVTACPLTCDNYNNPPEVCNAGCGVGCKCNDGYVLAKDGSCILPNQCPVTCGQNEYYSNCVIPCNTCSQKGNCFYQCYPGCDCFRGYYRNAQRKCVPEQQCPAAKAPNS